LAPLLLGSSAPQIPAKDPPQSPLKRNLGKIYAVSVLVENKRTSTGWPILPETNWNEIDINSLAIVSQKGVPIEYVAIENKDPRQWCLQINQKDYNVQFNALVYSSILDTKVAISTPWPSEWNQVEQLYLQPSRFIESDDSIFQDAVNVNGDPRSVSIHIAAKVLIRYCLNNIESSGIYSKTKNNIFTGLDLKGARYAVRTGKGSATDIVCVCVATLRAAGIPARSVIGITNKDTVGTVQVQPRYMVWGEYALPNAGWVPFVPRRMRGTVKGLSTSVPWQGLGTLPWLNSRIPLSYNFNLYDIDRSLQNIHQTFISSPQEKQ
jgi:hypothetical protein